MYRRDVVDVFIVHNHRVPSPFGPPRSNRGASERAARLMARFRPAHPQQMRKQNLSLLSRSLCFVNKRLTSSSPLLSSSPRGPPRGKAEPCSCGCTAVPLADEESARGREGERERELRFSHGFDITKEIGAVCEVSVCVLMILCAPLEPSFLLCYTQRRSMSYGARSIDPRPLSLSLPCPISESRS